MILLNLPPFLTRWFDILIYADKYAFHWYPLTDSFLGTVTLRHYNNFFFPSHCIRLFINFFIHILISSFLLLFLPSFLPCFLLHIICVKENKQYYHKQEKKSVHSLAVPVCALGERDGELSTRQSYCNSDRVSTYLYFFCSFYS